LFNDWKVLHESYVRAIASIEHPSGSDRIGNIGELSGYLSLWEGLKSTVERGLLAITVVEHDELTDDQSLPYLPVGNDGRAQKIDTKKT
jgi:hypothetical protein